MPQRLTENVAPVAASPLLFDLGETPAPVTVDALAASPDTDGVIPPEAQQGGETLPLDLEASPARRRIGHARLRAPRLPVRLAWRKRSGEKPRPESCLNCQTRMVGSFCHECGQENVTYVVSFGELLREMYSEFVQVDSRMVRTVGALIIRPGLLTNEFLNGKRVRYLSPFKMYVVVSALFFLLFTILNPLPFDDADVKDSPLAMGMDFFEKAADDKSRKVVYDSEATVAGSDAKTKEAAKQKTKMVPPTLGAKPTPPRVPAGNVAAQAATTNKPASATKSAATPSKKRTGFRGHLSVFGVNARDLPATVHEYRDQQKKLTPAKRHGLLQSFIALKIIRFETSPADTLRGIIYSTLPNVMVFMLPLFALLLKVMYLRSKRLYVEHFIFVLHTHTFMFVMLTLAMLSPWKFITWPVLLTIPLYNLLALRAVYRQSFPKTLLKGFLLWNAYGFLFIFAAILGLILAIFSTLLSPG